MKELDAALYPAMHPAAGITENHQNFFYRSIPNFTDSRRLLASPAYDRLLLFCSGVVTHKLLPGHWSWLGRPDFLSLRLVTAGDEYVRYDQKLYLAEKGDIMIFLPFRDYEYATGPSGFCRIRSLMLRGDMLEETVRHAKLAEQCFCTPEDTGFFDEAFDFFTRLLSVETVPEVEDNAAMAFRLIQRLSNLCPKNRIPERLKAIQHYIDRNLDRDLSRERLSTIFSCSHVTLNGLFRQYLNTSTHRYIVKCRMRTAGEMLREGNFSIKEIASRVGFSSQFNFSTEFKKYHGVSPREFRGEKRNREADC